MKILMVNKFLFFKGGAETYTLKLAQFLKEMGHDVQFFGMNSDENIVKNNLGLYTEEMDFHTSGLKKFLYPFKIIYSFDARKKIRKIIKDFKPDIIHLNNINFQLTPSIIDEAYKQKVPVVQTVHDYQMLCPNHLFYTKNQICEKCIEKSKFNCVKNNCIHNSKIKSLIGTIEAILYTRILKTYSKVQKYICPSYFIESKLVQASDIYKGKTYVIHNFIERKTMLEEKKEDYIIFFGRLSEEKGLNEFLNACKRLPNIKIKIAGRGPMENICNDFADNIEYVGFKTGEELDKLIAKARFLVYPSICYENCPLSISEAISLGTPVITANYGGMKELVEEDKTGVLLDEINVDTLIIAISELYNDKEKMEKMTRECLKMKEDMIPIEKYYEKLLKIYEEVKQ